MSIAAQATFMCGLVFISDQKVSSLRMKLDWGGVGVQGKLVYASDQLY